MINRRILLLSIVLISLFACVSAEQQKETQLLEEAAKVHKEAMDIENDLKDDLEALIQKANGINVKGRALEPEEIRLVEQINQLQASYRYWEENHIEVPGHDLHDHNHHGHNHDHVAATEYSAKDMLLIQKEFRDSILSIKKRVESLSGL